MKVVVVGGGISGLSVAFRVKREAEARGIALDLTLVEAAPRLGGTMHTETVNGFQCEWGPNGFLNSKPHTLALVNDLGLTDRLLPADEDSKRRFVMVDGRLIELPTSPGAFLTSSLLPLSGRFRVIWERCTRRGDPEKDETVAAFARRRLGTHAYERLINPFVSGIFAGDPERLSLRAAFPRLWELEREYGSLIKASVALRKQRAGGNAAGPSGHLTSLKGGMSELVDGLARALGPAVRTAESVSDVRRTPEGWVVTSDSGWTGSAVDRVILAVPAYTAAQLLRPFDAALAEHAAAIPYAAVSVVALGYRREDVAHPLDGFGFLVPRREKRDILGCLWSSSAFPGTRAPADHVLLRVMVGGACAPQAALLPDDELRAMVIGELEGLLGLSGVPSLGHIMRHRSAIPQYEVGHRLRVAALEEGLSRWPGLYVAGNAYHGVGINDCTREAERLASLILSVPPGDAA